jgi:hypothetical protein
MKPVVIRIVFGALTVACLAALWLSPAMSRWLRDEWPAWLPKECIESTELFAGVAMLLSLVACVAALAELGHKKG